MLAVAGLTVGAATLAFAVKKIYWSTPASPSTSLQSTTLPVSLVSTASAPPPTVVDTRVQVAVLAPIQPVVVEQPLSFPVSIPVVPQPVGAPKKLGPFNKDPRFGQLLQLASCMDFFGAERNPMLPGRLGRNNVHQAEQWLSECRHLVRKNSAKTIPPGIEHMPNLETIDLSGGRLTSLPKDIGLLTKLRFLDARNNQIEEIPNELIRLPEACEIKLEGNTFNLASILVFNNLRKGYYGKLTDQDASVEEDERASISEEDAPALHILSDELPPESA